MGVARTTYVIDENGMIEKVFEKAKPDTNAADVLAWLDGEPHPSPASCGATSGPAPWWTS